MKCQTLPKTVKDFIGTNFEPRSKSIVLLFEEKVEMFSDVSSRQKRLKRI